MELKRGGLHLHQLGIGGAQIDRQQLPRFQQSTMLYGVQRQQDAVGGTGGVVREGSKNSLQYSWGRVYIFHFMKNVDATRVFSFL